MKWNWQQPDWPRFSWPSQRLAKAEERFLVGGGVVLGEMRHLDGESRARLVVDEMRDWTHVKSTMVGPAHANFANVGGFHHIYANEEAMVGYRTRVFPEGSIVVFDRLEMRDNEGAFVEGPRQNLDVMVKDSERFATTGGWGFQRFVKDSKTEVADTPTPQTCFACHDRLKKDGLILGTYRP